MTATTDRALAEVPSRHSRTSAAKAFARLASTAAGRACRPDALLTTIGSDLMASPPASAAAAPPPATAMSRIASFPALTVPVTGVIDATRSSVVMTIWVSRLFACVAT
jgi:hypothetical protein